MLGISTSFDTGVHCGFQVSLIMGYIVDDGETLVAEASRTHPNFEGTGIHGRLRQFMSKECLKRSPRLQITRSSSTNTDFYSKRPTDNPVILTRVGLLYGGIANAYIEILCF